MSVQINPMHDMGRGDECPGCGHESHWEKPAVSAVDDFSVFASRKWTEIINRPDYRSRFGYYITEYAAWAHEMGKNESTAEKDRIKAFLTKMATQDNRGTAAPIFYVIRTEVNKPAPSDNCDSVQYRFRDETYVKKSDIIDLLHEEGLSPREIASKLSDEVEEYGIKKEWESRGMFLTETDAESHLKNNKHHYSPNAHTYVEHAWRAPELTQFFKDLFALFGVPWRN